MSKSMIHKGTIGSERNAHRKHQTGFMKRTRAALHENIHATFMSTSMYNLLTSTNAPHISNQTRRTNRNKEPTKAEP